MLKRKQLLVFTIITIIFLTVSSVQGNEEILSKKYDIITYDYTVLNEDDEILEEHLEQIVNLTLEEEWHWYLESKSEGETSAYKDDDGNRHVYYIKSITPYILPPEEPVPDQLVILLFDVIKFIQKEAFGLVIVVIIALVILSRFRM